MKNSSKEKTALTLIEVIVVVVIASLLIALLLPARSRPKEAARQPQCMENIKMILKAIKAYEAKHGPLPEVVNNKEGKPLYSWRVAILPYLGAEGKEAHEQIRLDEPWDSEHNVNIHAPACFRCPSCYESDADRTLTNYSLVVDRKTDSDNTPHPILLETIPGAHWLKPVDLTAGDFEKGPPPRRLRSDPSYSEFRFGSNHPGKVFVGLSDDKVTSVIVPPLEKKEAND